MRAVLSLFIVVAALSSLASSARAVPKATCEGLLAPVPFILCNDQDLALLDDEAEKLYALAIQKLTGKERSTTVEEREAWQESRSGKCDLKDFPGIIGPDTALRARPCLVELYRERIKRLGNSVSLPPTLVIAQPKPLNNSNGHFAIVASALAPDEAKIMLNRLSSDFPFEPFALFPPYDAHGKWQIVTAAYVSDQSAAAAARLADALGLSTAATTWHIPAPLSSAPAWTAVAVLEKGGSVRIPDAQFATPPRSTVDSVRAAAAVLKCYREYTTGAGSITIEQMHTCSGYWITPRALMRCALDLKCPALNDTIDGRAKLDGVLSAEKLTKNSQLVLRKEDTPPIPDAQFITSCKGSQSTQEAFVDCVKPTITAKYAYIQKCFAEPTESQRLSCFTDQVNDPNFTVLANCSNTLPLSRDNMLNCTPNPAVAANVQKMRQCLSDAGSSAIASGCLSAALAPTQKQLVVCLEQSKEIKAAAACLDGLSPAIASARSVVGCLASEERGSWAKCATGVAGPVAHVTQCLASKQDQLETAVCLIGDNPQVRGVVHVYQCAAAGKDMQSVITNCADGILDEKTSQVVGCIAGAGGDRTQLAGCVAAAAMPPDAARLVSCAADSTGPTSFALCAAGPYMNEDWRIAAECAVESGGNPVGFAGCTAGRLTMRELEKCFTGEIGKDCFGPHNTIVEYLTNEFHDLTQGPGKNNEIVKALDAIAEWTGGPNSVVNNPKQLLGGPNSVVNNPKQLAGGPNSMVNNPGQIWGGDSSVFNQAAGGKSSVVRQIISLGGLIH